MPALLIEINFLLLVITFNRYTFNLLSGLYPIPSEHRLYVQLLTLVFSSLLCLFILYPILLLTTFFLFNKYYQFATLGILSHFTVPWIWSGFESMFQHEFGVVNESMNQTTSKLKRRNNTLMLLPTKKVIKLDPLNYVPSLEQMNFPPRLQQMNFTPRLQPTNFTPRTQQPIKLARRPHTAPCSLSTQQRIKDRTSNRFTLVYSSPNEVLEKPAPPFEPQVSSTLFSEVSTQTVHSGEASIQPRVSGATSIQPSISGDDASIQPSVFDDDASIQPSASGDDPCLPGPYIFGDASSQSPVSSENVSMEPDTSSDASTWAEYPMGPSGNPTNIQSLCSGGVFGTDMSTIHSQFNKPRSKRDFVGLSRIVTRRSRSNVRRPASIEESLTGEGSDVNE